MEVSDLPPNFFSIRSAPTTQYENQIAHENRLIKNMLSALPNRNLLLILLMIISLRYYFVSFFAPRWSMMMAATPFQIHCLLLCVVIMTTSCYYCLSARPSKVYLVDFACLRPPSHLRVPLHSFIEHASLIGIFDQDSLDFMSKVIRNSGQGEQAYLPPCLHYLPPKASHEDCVEEAHSVLFPVMDDLLSRTNASPRDVDILIVNCSGFCPAPSLTAIVANRYRMRDDVKTYNLSGMGCAAGVLAVDLGRKLLLNGRHPESNAVVLSTEIVSVGWYSGKDRAKLVLNCLFRMGCSGVMLSNKSGARRRSKYELMCSLRTQRSFDDRAYSSVVREEDEEGITGVTIKKDLPYVAGELLRSHLSQLGRMILPFSEQALRAVSVVRRKLRFFIATTSKPPPPLQELYIPDFTSAVDHFCIPTSGRPLIKEIGRSLRLRPSDVEPALMTLHRFGNQSAASLWYELAYLEAKGRVKKGDKMWQLGMGTGPKANSVVWKSLKASGGASTAAGSPWADCIHDYPITPTTTTEQQKPV